VSTLETTRDRWAMRVIAAVSCAVVGLVAYLVTRPGGTTAPGVSMLPAVNAVLNATAAVLLTAGFVNIRRRNIAAHRACMLGAFATSTLFLVSYVAYHAQAAAVRFTGQGWIRPVYFFILVTHIVLAAAIVPLALTTIYRAFRAELWRHKRIARVTLPIWLYVSVTGVLVYLLLHRLSATLSR
jgi:putative membrane protein